MIGNGNISLNKLWEGDRQIWTILFILSLLSIPVVLSSVHTLTETYNVSPFTFLIRQLRNIALGIFAALAFFFVPLKRLNSWAAFMWIFSIALLIYTSLFATEFNEARRWLRIPIVGISFQPSDLAKITLIILMAQRISSKQDNIKNFKEVWAPLIIPIIITMIFIAPNDLSSALLLLLTVFLMMFVGRLNLKVIIGTILVGALFVTGLYFLGTHYPNAIRSATWKTRVVNYLEDRPDYQIQMREQAISNGGLFGVGPGKSLNKNYYNSPFTDFIYAVIAEEYGILGAVIVLFLYLWLFWRVFLIIISREKAFGAMLAFGLGSIITMQALMNMMVTLNMLPATGIPLPMVSQGGTSNAITGIAFGIILAVSRQPRASIVNKATEDS